MILLIYLFSISFPFGILQSIDFLDINKTLNDTRKSSNYETRTIRSINGHYNEEHQKETKFQTTTTTNNVPNYPSYRRINGTNLTEATKYESLPSRHRSHYKDNHTRLKNELSSIHLDSDNPTTKLIKNYTGDTQKKGVQFESVIIKYNLNSGVNMFEYTPSLSFRHKNDSYGTGKTDAGNSYDEFNFDDSNLTRRSISNIYHSVPKDEIIVSVDNNLNETQAKLEEVSQQIENPNRLYSNDLKEQTSNDYEDTSCDDDNCRSRSNELEKGNDDIASQLREPTKGFGISELINSRIMLMNHPRVCYACSSTNDPSCWAPDRRTSVKYCRDDHTSCLAKVFKQKGLQYIIRDCGSACEATSSSEYEPMYNSCTICHTDLCNSAFSAKIHLIIIIMFVLFHIMFSY